jgi:hypothetical protein
MHYEKQATALRSEYADTVKQLLDLLGDLDAVQLLRSHAPPARQSTVDRLDTALRLLCRIEDELEDVGLMAILTVGNCDDEN